MKTVNACLSAFWALALVYSSSATAQDNSSPAQENTPPTQNTTTPEQETPPPISESALINSVKKVVQEANDGIQTTESILDKREKSVKESNVNPFSISQYRQNYLLPITHVKSPNPISVNGLTDENIDNFEAKYQISVNMPLYLMDDDASGVFFGMTLISFWQVYNDETSKPFRENNYEPEVYYQWQTDWDVFGYRFNQFNIGLNHQSNGQSGLKSRSWNRIYATAIFSDVDSLYYLKTWYRLPEDEKTFALDPTGDDNPDIIDFIGRTEFGFGFNMGKLNLLTKVRNNLSFNKNRGSVELNLTYPINDRYDWLLQYFNGYGDSLIDYNRHQQRIGLGIQLKLF
ncbi:phospholipase A [Brumicola pallidula]|uniref:Phospholipase A1 n=1 Tax=Brumicola pallidula DSM 14239 = ACAM 615 TaxID=1121922 RepID=K6ZG75_9ALTE|nr:phospholipase A [Glaciecola pallidula]GAC27933.1 phospholipase A1 [Glaciecola pallidula DSM 14239 = ACAM 615]